MLLRALVNRLNFGTDTYSTTLPSSHRRSLSYVYQCFPSLATIILQMLGEGKGTSLSPSVLTRQRIEKVFPALEILERYGIPPSHAKQIRGLLEEYMACPSWPLREKASKALTSSVDEDEILSTLQTFLTLDHGSQNALHGKLLVLKWLLRFQKVFLSKEVNGRI